MEFYQYKTFKTFSELVQHMELYWNDGYKFKVERINGIWCLGVTRK